jgi:hypothetical protein
LSALPQSRPKWFVAANAVIHLQVPGGAFIQAFYWDIVQAGCYATGQVGQRKGGPHAGNFQMVALERRVCGYCRVNLRRHACVRDRCYR